MRQIKFRAWKNGKRAYPVIDVSNPFPSDYVFDQYTGKKDLNGEEMYHNDYIRRYNYVYRVVWDEETAAFGYVVVGRYKNGRSGEIEAEEDGRFYPFSNDSEMINEVIGNVYGNPLFTHKN